MFSLNQKVKLASVNARAELHGEEAKPAFDLKIEATVPSDALIESHPELRQFLFKRDENPDLVGQIAPDGLTALRDILLGDCKVDHFKFEPVNGGCVNIMFRIIAHPQSVDVGKLCDFIQKKIDLTVMPPAPATVQELFGGEQKKRKGVA